MRRILLPALTGLALLQSLSVARAGEIVEEIVAWVNGDIITRSELESEEQAVLEDVYQRFSGEELERHLDGLRGQLLLRMIDRKILVDEARRLYDVDTMGRTFLDSFKEQQGIESEAEFQKLLEQEGMTVDEVKRRLIEMFAPEEVMRFKVTSRIAISDREVREFYEQNQARFTREPDVTLREIVLLADTPERRAERRAEAQAIRDRTVAGEDFAELARQLSEAGTRESGGSLGTLERSDLAPALAEPAFALPVGAVSEPIETDHGFHIIKVEARDDSTVEPFESVEERIRELLQRTKTASEVDAYLADVRARSEWCVKKEFVSLMPIEATSDCNDL
jgi:parvulin-like peptidyl-prolyl isomerase